MWLKAGLGVDTQSRTSARVAAGLRASPDWECAEREREKAVGELRDGWARRLGSGHEMVLPPAHAGASCFDVSIPKVGDQTEISRVGLTYENTVILDGNSKPVGIYLDVGPLGWV